MADEGDSSDKTEDPTQKRLDDALERGDVVKSQEVNTWFMIAGATLVLHLAVQRMDELAPELAAHYGADCPVAVVARASRDDELVLRGTLADIAGQVTAAGVRRTAIVVVGRVLAAEQFLDSHLYSTTRCR